MFGIVRARGLYAPLVVVASLIGVPALAGEAVEVTASTLNVRTGASTRNARIGQVSRGQHYPVLQRSGAWVRIQLDHRSGWSHGSYLRASNATVYRTTAASLNVRSGASTRYRVLGRLPNGTRVAVNGSSGSWRRISHNGRLAWVHGSYLRADGGSTPPPVTPPPVTPPPVTPPPSRPTHTVTAGTLNVRSGPGTNHGIVGRLSRGDRVTVTGSSGSWKQIVRGSGRAWVYGPYLAAGTSNRRVSRAGFIQLPASGAGFVAYSVSSRRWGKPGLIYGTERAARRYHAERGGARIRIGNISLENGGRMPPHVSHRLGEDIDVGPMRTDRREAPVLISYSTYSRTLTRRVIEFMRAEIPVELILFNDTRIPGVRYYSGHHNHFHLRMR